MIRSGFRSGSSLSSSVEIAMHQDPPPAPPESSSWFKESDGAHDATIEANWLFQLRRERFRSRLSAKVHDYYVIHMADAVQAIVITPEQSVVLVRQFRAGSRRDSLEPPGGLLDEGEDPREAAAREVLEETGYAGDPAEWLGSAYAIPSLLTSKIFTVVIRNARRVAEPKLDVGEEVAVELVSAAEIPAMIREGQFDHALAVMGFFLWLTAGGSPPRAEDSRVSV